MENNCVMEIWFPFYLLLVLSNETYCLTVKSLTSVQQHSPQYRSHNGGKVCETRTAWRTQI
jgi:hypothetical protein